jgi:hypothetical protein
MSDFNPIFDRFLEKLTFLSRGNKKIKGLYSGSDFHALGEKKAVE